MIIGPRFAWLHFPKTAGSEIEGVLRKQFGTNRDLAFDDIDPNNEIWHHTLGQRKNFDSNFSTEDRDIICGIRRLPSWLLSVIHYNKSRAPDFVPTREMVLKGQFFEPTGEVNNADLYAWVFAPGVTHWLRQEFLQEDLIKCFSPHLPLEHIDFATAFEKKNKTQMDYIGDVSFYFTANDIATLYKANPTWAEIEKMVYGDTLHQDGLM